MIDVQSIEERATFPQYQNKQIQVSTWEVDGRASMVVLRELVAVASATATFLLTLHRRALNQVALSSVHQLPDRTRHT